MKKKLLFIIIILGIAVIAVVATVIPKKYDFKGIIISVNTVQVSDDLSYVILNAYGTEYGYDSSVYIRITDKTKLVNKDNKIIPMDSFIKGDIICVYYDKKATQKNMFTAKKIIYETNIYRE